MSGRAALLLLVILIASIAAACQSDPIIVTRLVEVTEEMTRVEETIITTTPVPPTSAPIPTLTPVPQPTNTPTPAPTRALSPIQATQQALIAMAEQFPTTNATPGLSLASVSVDDYPAMVNFVCETVLELYAWEDLKGVDWEAICVRYVNRTENLTSTAELWPLLEDIIAELDPFIIIDTPEEIDLWLKIPNPYGIGDAIGPGFIIYPAPEDEILTIWNVCEEGAAADAGLVRGDVILAIDGQTITPGPDGFDHFVIYQALYDSGKTETTLTVQRGPDNEPEELTLTYTIAESCDIWRFGLLFNEPDIGYVRIPFLLPDPEITLLRILSGLEADAPLDGLILDMRHENQALPLIRGDEANGLISLFTEGSFGTFQGFRSDSVPREFAVDGPVQWNETTPIVILVDGATRASLEFFAVALQQSGRAKIVGMPTIGQPYMRRPIFLPGGAILRVPAEVLVLPDGTVFEYNGITPDVVVPLGSWGLRQYPDIQLDAAYQVLLEQIEP